MNWLFHLLWGEKMGERLTDPNLWSSLPNISAASCSLLHPIFIATRWFKPWSFSSPNVGGYQQAFKRVTFKKIPKRSQSQNCQARDIFVVSFLGWLWRGPHLKGRHFPYGFWPETAGEIRIFQSSPWKSWGKKPPPNQGANCTAKNQSATWVF